MRHLDYHAIVAIILATGASLTIIILALLQWVHEGHVSTEEATLLSTALGAVIGAVATYLGGKVTENNRENHESPRP